jgi:serine/threonine protein kinase
MPEQSAMERNPLSDLNPAELLMQGAVDDTFAESPYGGFTPPTLEELAGIFPRFEFIELIGKGGMGAVYKVRQPELDRVVALKILPPDIATSETFATRFTREAKALAKLNHPGIVTIHESGREGDLYYFLMEYVDGVNLRQLLDNSRISPREAMAIVPQICDALQFAHDRGIVHCDIKPENILLNRLGAVKVADFGIAKLIGSEEPAGTSFLSTGSLFTDTGKVVGTPQYMAPEQRASSSEVDHRADIFALGVVFYQMLTGELPEKDLQPPSKKIHLDVRLDQVVLRALEKNPELRYRSATEMRTGIETISLSPSHAIVQKSHHIKLWPHATIAFAAALLIGGIWIMLQRPEAERDLAAPPSIKEAEANPPRSEASEPPLEFEQRLLDLEPTLEGMAWQNELDERSGARKGITWTADGTRPQNVADWPKHAGLGAGDEAQPRYLCMWFTHPLIDGQSVSKVTLVDAETNVTLPFSNHAHVKHPIYDLPNGSTGWIAYTKSLGDHEGTLDRAVISLRYSIGGWREGGDFLNGSVALGDGAFISQPGQNQAGYASVQIASDKDFPDLRRQLRIQAVTKDGKIFDSNGSSGGSNGTVYSQTLSFPVRLADVEKFTYATRPIREARFPVVLIRSEEEQALHTYVEKLIATRIRSTDSAESDAHRTQAGKSLARFILENPTFPNKASSDLLAEEERIARKALTDISQNPESGTSAPINVRDYMSAKERFAAIRELVEEDESIVTAATLPADNHLQIRSVSPNHPKAETLNLKSPANHLTQIKVSPEVIIWDEHITGASLHYIHGKYSLHVRLSHPGAKRFQRAAKYSAQRRQNMEYAVFVDNKIRHTSLLKGDHTNSLGFPMDGLHGDLAQEILQSIQGAQDAIKSIPAFDWAEKIDQEKDEHAYHLASNQLKNSVTLEQWRETIKKSRNGLRDGISRNFFDLTEQKEMDGAPRGEYRVIRFNTYFYNKKTLEKVTLIKEDGEWRVAGYTIE